MRRLWVGWCACLLLGAACAPAQQGQGSSGQTFGHLQVAATMHTYRVTYPIGQITSLVLDDLGRIVLSDHVRLFVLTRAGAGYSIAELTRPSVPVWQPTGLAYHGGLLYVANGPGHDVLVLRLTDTILALVRRFTSPLLASPQSIGVEQDGSMIVADQGGSSVLKLSSQGQVVWQTRLGNAHGVVETGGSIYATSLENQTVTKLTTSGKIIQTEGRTGVSSGRYLRPVGLSSGSGGTIVVTDAYNGRVTVLDSNLRVVQQLGGNGPGMDAFNIPTATLQVADGYYIADSYRQRLVHTNARWVVQDQIALGPMVPTGRQRPLVYGSDARPYTYPMLPGVDVPAALGLRTRLNFAGAFDGLDQVGTAGSPAHLTFDDTHLGATGPTWAQIVGAYVVVGSPTNTSLEVIDPATGMFTYVDVGNDSWPRLDSLLLASNLRLPLTQVIAPAVTAFSRAAQLRAQGASRQDAFNRALSANGAPRNWAQDLSSPAAQQFLHSAMTVDDARRYYTAALQQNQIRVVELLEVKYLSGA